MQKCNFFHKFQKKYIFVQIEYDMHNLHNYIKRRLESDIYKRMNDFSAY